MKTILTTIFAIALMVFAFNSNPVMAGGGDSGLFGWITGESQVDELREPDEAEVAGGKHLSVKSPSRDDNDFVKEVLHSFALFGDTYCVENPDDFICSDAWNSEDDYRELVMFDGCYLDKKTNQWYCVEFNEDENDTRELAMSVGCTTDWVTGENVCCVPSSAGGMFCYYPIATDNESQTAGLTREEKRQQDEDDWNAYILRQFAGYMDHCLQSGNCMMNDYPDSESTDGFSGRAVADSGNEASILEAGQRPNEVEGKDGGL